MAARVIHIFIFFMLAAGSARTQIPLGSWREHLSYMNGIQVAASGNRLYCSTPQSLMFWKRTENSIERLSALNGLSGIGISTIASDEKTGSLLIAYQNSDVDIIQDNGIFNVNEILLKNSIANKKIHRIWWNGDQVFLATAFGIILLDAKKHQVKDSYIIGNAGAYLSVNAVAADAGFLYAATNEGLKRGALNTNLADYRLWTNISGSLGLPAGEVKDIIVFNNKIIAAIADTLWLQTGNSWARFYADGFAIRSLRVQGNQLLVTQTSGATNTLLFLKSDGSPDRRINASAALPKPMDAVIVSGETFIADSLRGLLKESAGNYQVLSPASPAGFADGEMAIGSNSILVAAGNIGAQGLGSSRPAALYRFREESWQNIDSSTIPSLAGKRNLVSVAEDPANGSVWLGSFGDGLFNLSANNTVQAFKENSFLKPADADRNFYGVGGLAFDTENNLWITNYGSSQGLLVRKKDGSTRNFPLPVLVADFALTRILIDDENQKWIIAPNSNGLFCFNSGQNLDNTADDRWKRFLKGAGNGNLPDNTVLSIAKDRSGFIWVGTLKGIGIIQCTGNVFSNQSCEAELPIVQQDNFAGYLFANEQVQTIAVDGADRKWIGTKNGAWLLSRYGEKTLQHFTTANSKLIDNDVKNIVVDPVSGEVFFQTGLGICSYRSDATGPEASATKVLVFPNPVPPQYSGSIAIRGLKPNVIVKITATDGRLVHQARANGSTMSWNGLNYRGKAVAPGVYLVLTSDDNGKDQLATKIVIIK